MHSIYSRDAPVLATLIDHHAQNNPATPIYVFPSSNGARSQISHYEFSRACERVGRLIQPDITNLQEEVVGLLGDCDTLVYQTVVAGCACQGIVVFPLSPRNSPAAIAHLIHEVSVTRVLVSKASFTTLISGIDKHLAECNTRVTFEDLPTLADLYPYLARETVPEVIQPMRLPKRRSFVNGIEVYMHSSGSTGMPKAIGYSHQFLAKARHMRSFTEFTDNPSDILISTAMLPGFHCMGFFWQLLYPLMTGKPVAIFTPQHPNPPIIPTPSLLLESFIQSNVKAAFVVPAFLEAWIHQPASVSFLATMDVVGFGGAPLALEIGNALTQSGVRIVPVYGLTEAGSTTKFLGSTQAAHDWAWLQFAENASIRWVSQGEGLHELQLITNEQFGLAVENLPDVPGYATRDLWVKHPSQDLWRPVGRLDDVIVMANGEKAMPGPLEGAVISSKLVQGALAFGRERSQLGILVELSSNIQRTDEEDLASLRNDIWPCLESANLQVPTFARIYKEMIIFTDSSKPLIRTPKGNVNRTATIAAYAREIASLYASLDHYANHGGVPPPNEWEVESVKQWLSALVEKLAKDGPLDADTDIFSKGFDSLSATYLRNSVTSTLRAVQSSGSKWTADIPQEFAYMYPTVNKMTTALLSMIESSSASAPTTSRSQAIADMIDKYAADMPFISTSPGTRGNISRTVVVITGTTGGLGSEILVRLLRDDAVAHVYALNRLSSKQDLNARQLTAFRMRGIDQDYVLSPKLTLVACDVSDTNCGLSESLYVKIRDSVDVVIHNAWKLDFNLALAAFEPHIKATRQLLDLVFASPRAAVVRFLFTSSIAAVQGWNTAREPCPESPINDPTVAIGTGYGESKYVAEQILLRACQQGIQSTSFRIEQVTGNAESGAWSLSDWVPLMVKSCVNVGQMPTTDGMVSWVSSASVTQLLVDAVAVKSNLGTVINVAHPHPTSFNDVLQAINEALVAESIISEPLPTVSFAAWVDMIERLSVQPSARDLNAIPAIKLIPFFRKASVSPGGGNNALGAIDLIVDNARDVSVGFQSQDQLDGRAALGWVRYWKCHGLFEAAC